VRGELACAVRGELACAVRGELACAGQQGNAVQRQENHLQVFADCMLVCSAS
jgi:hypothetical protein